MPSNITLNEGAKDLSVAGNYSTAAVPVNGDSLSIVNGSQLIDAGLATLTAVNLALMFMSAGFKGSTGAAGTPMELGTTTLLEIDGGGGIHHFKTGTTALCRVVGSGGGKIYLAGGTYTNLVQLGGDLEIGGAATVTNFKQLGGTCLMRALSTGAAGTTAIIDGGTLISDRSIATIESVNPQSRITLRSAAAVTTKLRMMHGLHTHLSSGTITYLEGIGGTFSTRGAEKKFTVTAGELWRRFVLDDSSNLSYITWTAAPTLYGFRGGGALA